MKKIVSIIIVSALCAMSLFAENVPFGMLHVEKTSDSAFLLTTPGGALDLTLSVAPEAVSVAMTQRCAIFKMHFADDVCPEASLEGDVFYSLCTEGGQDMLLKVGVSLVSEENASANLASEIPDWDFDAIKASADALWEEQFSKIELKSLNALKKGEFYYNLRTAFSGIGLISDCNGYYTENQKVPMGRNAYGFFGEQAPSLSSLIALLAPSVASDLVSTFRLMNVPGYCVEAADAYAFGARQFDNKEELEFMMSEITSPGWGDEYTLENASTDHAVANYAVIACEDPFIFFNSGIAGRMEGFEGDISRSIPSNPAGSDYVFAALGMYPYMPGERVVKFSRPYFRKAVVHACDGDLIVYRRQSEVKVGEVKFACDSTALLDDLFYVPSKEKRVDTVMGNGGHAFSASYVFAGATYPFGMVQMTVSPFDFLQNLGFVANQTNGTGCPNMGNFPMLPLKGALTFSPEHMMNNTVQISSEKGHPGYYEASVQKDIKAEFTTTERTGISRLSFPTDTSTIIIGTGISSVLPLGGKEFISEGRITGPRSCEGFAVGTGFCGIPSEYKVYFVAEFDRDAIASGCWKGSELMQGSDTTDGGESGVYFTFDTSSGKTIHYKVALSYVSVENARENLASENPGWDFATVQRNCEAEWDKWLGKIEVKGSDPIRQKQFYMHMYHCFMHPNVYSDVNGEYIGSDWKVHKSAHKQYQLFSNWDTYRTQIQLLSILDPVLASDIVNSHLDFAEQAGDAFPRWSMVNIETGVMQGDPSSILVSNAWAFGARNFDAGRALRIMRNGAENPGVKCQNFEVRPDLQKLFDEGFCKPSLQLEYVSADFAISRLAKDACGDNETSKTYLERSQSWKNLFNPENGWLQNRNPDGSWKEFDYGWGDYVEASYQAYFWMVPFSINSLIDLIGKEKAEERLDNHFVRLDADIFQDWFAICNEPSFQIPWTYNWLGKPDKTSEVINRVITERFGYSYSGLPGNDDVGAMAAWYIFASCGLYPYIPGVGGFTLNTPIFSDITMHLPGGDVVIKGGSERNIYTTSLTLDGKPYDKSWIDFDDIKDGAKLFYKTSKEPKGTWANTYCPPSF